MARTYLYLFVRTDIFSAAKGPSTKYCILFCSKSTNSFTCKNRLTNLSCQKYCMPSQLYGKLIIVKKIFLYPFPPLTSFSLLLPPAPSPPSASSSLFISRLYSRYSTPGVRPSKYLSDHAPSASHWRRYRGGLRHEGDSSGA